MPKSKTVRRMSGLTHTGKIYYDKTYGVHLNREAAEAVIDRVRARTGLSLDIVDLKGRFGLRVDRDAPLTKPTIKTIGDPTIPGMNVPREKPKGMKIKRKAASARR